MKGERRREEEEERGIEVEAGEKSREREVPPEGRDAETETVHTPACAHTHSLGPAWRAGGAGVARAEGRI